MSERPSGTVTFLFSDVEGSTSLLDGIGPTAYAAELASHRSELRAAWESHDGVEIDTQGDSFFVAFARARDAAAAARAAQIALAEHAIRVRIGIHTGDALHEADRFFGTTVNYAARVASHALGGEVLVSNVVHQLVSDSDIEFLESRDVELKGIEGFHRLFAVDLA